MSGSSAFFILIPAMYLLFTLALATIAFVDRRLIAARWASLGFAIACASILVDGYREPGGDVWASWFSVATHFLPLLVMIQAFLSRHKRNAPVFAIVLTLVACVYVMPDMIWAPPHWFRGLFVQLLCCTIIASGLPILWSYRSKSPVDLMAFIAVLGAALSYAGRTVVIALNPIGENQQGVVAFYEGLNIVFHAASALMGMAVGIVLMMTIGYDMMRLRTEESEIDPLTRLGNRRRLDRQVTEDEVGKRAIGATIVVDLDHFKKVNDQYGHDAGDQVLRAVGKCLKKLFKNFGVVCRTGGEEFVVLVDAKHADGVSSLALAARKGISGLSFDGVLVKANVTASVGFHCRDASETVQEAIQQADQAVYCAKADGRDRVVGAVIESGMQVLKAVA